MFDETKTRDMTEGDPLRHIIGFAVPLIAGNLLQQLYGVVDTAVVGRGVSTQALAAVGASVSLSMLIIDMINGFTNGFAISVTKHFGSKDEDRIKKSVIMSFYLSMLIAVVMSVLSLIFSRPLLQLLGTPSDIIDLSVLYISVIFAGIPTMVFYNMSAGVLRSFGNSTVPLLVVSAASILNILADLLFVLVFRWGVVGVALGTVLANVFCCPVCIFYLKKLPQLKFCREDYRWDMKMAGELLYLGAPMACMHFITAAGVAILQFVVNSMGSLIVAAYVVAHRIVEFSYQSVDLTAYSTSVFVGQNAGAGRLDRVKQSVRTAFGLCFGLSAVIAVVLIFFGKPIIALFVGSDSAQVISAAYPYLAVCGSMIWSLGLLFLYRCALQVLGNTVVPMFSGLIELALRLAVVFILPQSWGFYRICMAESAAWLFAMLMLLAAYKSRIRVLEKNPVRTEI